jgi:hypothetical protein
MLLEPSPPRLLTAPLPHCLTALLALLASSPTLADAIVITKAMTASTIAEVFIQESTIRVELEIGGQDLPAFRNLMPDSVYERMGYDPEPLTERLPRFFRQDLTFRADGTPLSGRVLEMEPRQRVRRDEITGEPLPVPEGEGELVIYAVLEYPYSGRPASLAMSPPRERGFAAANIGFVVYHTGLPVIDFRYFGTEEILDLDWDDPWYSRFRNKNLRRQYDAPLNAFLYVEPYEVRTEIIARPRDLQQWTDLGLSGMRTLPVEMQPGLKRQVADFLAQRLQLTIDGQPVTPTLDRIHFLRRTLRTSTVIDPPEELDANSATLGVIFVQPTLGLPQEAALTWELFSPRIQRVPAAATDEAGPLRFFLIPDDNVLWWKNFLKNPTVPTLVEIAPPPGLVLRTLGWLGWLCGLALAVVAALQISYRIRGHRPTTRGVAAAAALLLLTVASFALTRPARMTDDRAQEIVSGLLHNIYRAFDFRDEGTIYDVLERSVTGDLLTQTYLETRRGLELASQGGARAKVKQMEMIRVEPRKLTGEPGFAARCVWNVSGAVGHWGHIHQRTNQYEAEMTVQPVNGVWKLTRLELLQEERI